MLALGAAACGGGGGEAEPAAASAAEEAPAAEAGGAESATVAIDDLTFTPADVEIAAGGSVTWNNAEDVPHTVTFKDESVASSEELAQGDDFSATFDGAGTYDYVCAIHPDMKGTVTVK